MNRKCLLGIFGLLLNIRGKRYTSSHFSCVFKYSLLQTFKLNKENRIFSYESADFHIKFHIFKLLIISIILYMIYKTLRSLTVSKADVWTNFGALMMIFISSLGFISGRTIKRGGGGYTP